MLIELSEQLEFLSAATPHDQIKRNFLIKLILLNEYFFAYYIHIDFYNHKHIFNYSI